jgi:MmyB-like transcription regulator ligand binding domain
MTGAAAYVSNERLDVLATNALGRALFSELYAGPARPANHARFVFLDPRAETFYADWDRAARDTAAILRIAAGRDPHDRDLTNLVGELATQSETFRTTGLPTTCASTQLTPSSSTIQSSETSRSASPPGHRRRRRPNPLRLYRRA